MQRVWGLLTELVAEASAPWSYECFLPALAITSFLSSGTNQDSSRQPSSGSRYQSSLACGLLSFSSLSMGREEMSLLVVYYKKWTYKQLLTFHTKSHPFFYSASLPVSSISLSPFTLGLSLDCFTAVLWVVLIGEQMGETVSGSIRSPLGIKHFLVAICKAPVCFTRWLFTSSKLHTATEAQKGLAPCPKAHNQ